MKTLIAVNAFKGAPIGVVDINSFIAKDFSDVEIFPIADGGDGTLSVLKYFHGSSASVNKSVASDPLRRKIEAEWISVSNEAFIEMAKVSGLSLLKEEERDPLLTTAYGLGELIESVIDKGFKSINIFLGGSSTVDCGVGMIEALGGEIKDSSIDFSRVQDVLKDVKLSFLCDVSTPLISESGNDVLLYANQKFSNPSDDNSKGLQELKEKVDVVASLVDKAAGKKISLEPFTGAAGGVAYIPLALLGAKCFPGFDYIKNKFELEKKIIQAEVVVTGEGKLDSQTFEGKAPGEIIKLAKKYNKKTIFYCALHDECDWKSLGVDEIKILDLHQRQLYN